MFADNKPRNDQVLHGNIDQTLVNSLHGLLYFEIGGSDRRVITTEYISRIFEYICNTYFVMHWSMSFIQYFLVNIHIQYLARNFYWSYFPDEWDFEFRMSGHFKNWLCIYSSVLCIIVYHTMWWAELAEIWTIFMVRALTGYKGICGIEAYTSKHGKLGNVISKLSHE